MAETAKKRGEGRKGEITKYMAYINDFSANVTENRKQQTVDVNYYHGNQLTLQEKNALDARKQPIIIINRMRAAINGMLGVLIEQNTQPRALGRGPSDEGAADVATDTLRYLADVTNWKEKKVKVARDIITAGQGAVIISADRKTGKIDLSRIRWNELIYDPRSREEDFSDAKYMGIQKWAYSDDVKAMYPNADFNPAEIVSASGFAALEDEAGSDRPRAQGTWVTPDKSRVLLVELYYQEGGDWYKVVFTAAGVLEENKTWLKDSFGGYMCPIIAQAAYVDDDNNRHGPARDMRSVQDEINKRRGKLLHLLSVAQIQAKDPSAIEVDAEEARREAARPDGIIPFGWERVRNQDLVQGQAQLLAESKSEIERMGPNPAILGRQGADTSGKALSARQAAGMTELAIIFAGIDDMERRIYRALWLAAQQTWTEPMWIRITEDEEDPRYVMLNEPEMGPVQGVTPDGQPAFDPYGQPIMVEDVLGYKNQIAQLDVDIMIDDVAATPNLQTEQLERLMDLIARNPNYAQIIPPSLIFELVPMNRKRQLMKKVQKYEEEAKQQAQQMQAQQMQMEIEAKQASTAKDLSAANLNDAKAEELGWNAETYAQQTQNSLEVAVMNARTKQASDRANAEAKRSNGNPDAGG